jgi:hypothetical protein
MGEIVVSNVANWLFRGSVNAIEKGEVGREVISAVGVLLSFVAGSFSVNTVNLHRV